MRNLVRNSFHNMVVSPKTDGWWTCFPTISLTYFIFQNSSIPFILKMRQVCETFACFYNSVLQQELLSPYDWESQHKLKKTWKRKKMLIFLMEEKKSKEKQLESSKNPPQGVIFRNLIIVWAVYLFSHDWFIMHEGLVLTVLQHYTLLCSKSHKRSEAN